MLRLFRHRSQQQPTSAQRQAAIRTIASSLHQSPPPPTTLASSSPSSNISSSSSSFSCSLHHPAVASTVQQLATSSSLSTQRRSYHDHKNQQQESPSSFSRSEKSSSSAAAKASSSGESNKNPRHNKNNTDINTNTSQQQQQRTLIQSSSTGVTQSAPRASAGPLHLSADSPNLRESYREAVEKRVIGNAALRRLIKNLHTSQYGHAVEAVEGAKLGGLMIDSDTCEVYLSLLLSAGQLKQAMDVYHYMLQNRVCPNTRSFNQLMDLCIQKQSWESALSLFSEMQRRGRQPDVESYERALLALSVQEPPNWERAVVIFDKLKRNKNALNSHTYNALMKVYLNMQPFDWRVVYNAYLEMRAHSPPIPFGWNSYKLVAAAMRRGRAGKIRRMTTFVDAWVQITHPFSIEMFMGMFIVITTAFVVRLILFKIGQYVYNSVYQQQSESDTVDL